MSIDINHIRLLENLILELGVKSIKFNGQIVSPSNCFNTQNLALIKDTIEHLIQLNLHQEVKKP